LQVGIKQDQAIAPMGQPEKREAYGRTAFPIYPTNHTGISDAEHFTPIAIVELRSSVGVATFTTPLDRPQSRTLRSARRALIGVLRQVRTDL
jgi:hypothetical protein